MILREIIKKISHISIPPVNVTAEWSNKRIIRLSTHAISKFIPHEILIVTNLRHGLKMHGVFPYRKKGAKPKTTVASQTQRTNPTATHIIYTNLRYETRK